MDGLSFEASLADLMTPALEAIVAALENIAETMAGVAETISAGMQESAAATQELQLSMDELAASVDASAAAVDANTAAVDANTEATKANKDAAEGAAGAHSQFASSAKAMVMPLTIATALVVGTGAAAIHMAADFQSGLTTLVTGAGESQSNLGMIHDGILQMSVDTGESTKQLIDGMFMIESAGHHGADALQVLQASAEGAKVGAADLGTVADATTTIMTDFANQHVTAANAVNELIATVSSGKTHMQDLAGAMAQILPTASAAGISLNGVMGAMATMTGEGVPAANAATYLRQTIIALEAPSKQTETALKSVGLTTKQVADAMHKSLPDALAMITDAVGKKFPVGSAGYVSAIKAISGGSKQMQGMLDLTGQHMATFVANTKNIGDAAQKGGKSITGWALVQQDFNQQMSEGVAALQVTMIKFGEVLMPVAQALVKNLTPAIKDIGTWIGAHGKEAAIAFGLIAAVLGGALVTALGAASVAFFTMDGAALPAIAVGAAIAGLAAGFVLAYNNIQPFHDAVNGVVTALSHWRDGLADVVGFFQMAKTPLEIVTGILLTAFLPSLISTGVAAGVTAVTMAGSFITSVVASGVAMMVMAAQGIASAVTGFIAYAAAGWAAAAATIAATWPILLIIVAIAALVAGIILLVTHWKQVSAWLSSAWNAVVKGVGAGFSWLGTQAQNVVQTVGGWFSWLGTQVQSALNNVVANVRRGWNLVVADVRQAASNFVGVIIGLDVRLHSAVHDHVIAPITSAITGLISLAEQWGKNLIAGLISGITSKASAVASAAGGIAGTIAGFLAHHSPAEMGPGATSDEWMPNLIAMLAGGLEAGAPLVGAAANTVAGRIAGALGATGGGTLGANGGAFPASALATGAGANGGAGRAITVNVSFKDEASGFMAGARLLSPGVMQQLAQQIAKEMQAQGLLQGRQPIGYTGSK